MHLTRRSTSRAPFGRWTLRDKTALPELYKGFPKRKRRDGF